jgi:hypothetical protein
LIDMPIFFIRVLQVLLGIAFAVLLIYVVVYVLGLLGLAVTAKIETVLLVIFVLLAIIGGLSGWMDPWFHFRTRPPNK